VFSGVNIEWSSLRPAAPPPVCASAWNIDSFSQLAINHYLSSLPFAWFVVNSISSPLANSIYFFSGPFGEKVFLFSASAALHSEYHVPTFIRSHFEATPQLPREILFLIIRVNSRSFVTKIHNIFFFVKPWWLCVFYEARRVKRKCCENDLNTHSLLFELPRYRFAGSISRAHLNIRRHPFLAASFDAHDTNRAAVRRI